MSQALLHAALRHAEAHADGDGLARTPIEGVTVMRALVPTGVTKSIYKPVICLILQGAKQVAAGPDSYVFAAGQVAVISADVPVASRIIKASRAEPYLAVAVDLDLSILLELAAQVAGPVGGPLPPVLVDDTDAAVADCALRLMRLLDRAEAIAVLRPSILRELHYWLLAGRHGAAVRGLAGPDGVAQHVARAVAVLRAEFDAKLTVERLAAVAGMSPSSFHQHFRAVTSLSPLQFQKQLRLIEARRRMLNDGLSATRAAFEVGYGSVSHFTREYGRMFGQPPRRDLGESRTA